VNVMRKKTLALFVILVALSFPVEGVVKKRNDAREATGESTGAILWRNPTDIATRNLFYGPGGREHQPHSKFTFLKEDLNGTNPKYVVRDQDGVKWKVKLGAEARPETVASRLIWAVGYFANEDYFLRDLQVSHMPVRLHRGRKLVAPDGSMHNVRLKRYLDGEEKIAYWRWRHDAFTGTRELNGLRVMMALINNWDLKDDNNAVVEEGHAGGSAGPERIYMVSDLGASFGTAGLTRPHERAKGNVESYSRSKFIRKVTQNYVDFQVPARPALVYLADPPEFISRLGLCWIGRHIPRSDARWMAQLLGRLSPDQIRDAFRAAGYSSYEVQNFTSVVEERIAQLNEL
jgi:hypothetical protein